MRPVGGAIHFDRPFSAAEQGAPEPRAEKWPPVFRQNSATADKSGASFAILRTPAPPSAAFALQRLPFRRGGRLGSL